ncbi:MAG: hypothetical protein A3H01_00890 [Candidatus Wildermuthbacteria bacterium RIFCSPLOWO2_12_FULL_40_9]|uniref:Uncharacterized protein n=2 Tax=Candidatus Wildermuthiibacteriota TaxID=1817923 RepID=A0A1G2RDJ3_9BACT|nr:MAG: hypothetical protein A3F15_02110 [Candidatus Wildermuthbacteria bacterium RIFCSPHIGHO2_12_FULL_40_12]OHA76817.1 MAG: hypothetical protein A3H01_00890 [Candidatus Wildermuthbacteria bacterium RIFCSPLOWO2_12_FULL_40_9]
MSKEKSGPKNLNKNLKQLAEIAEWFDKREEIDVEEGLEKVKKAVFLIKESKARLKAVENEFEEIKKKIDTKENDGDEDDKEDNLF